MTTRDVVVAGALPRHQVREYLKAMEPAGVEWQVTWDRHEGPTRFTITATEAQWGQIQEWVKKVTG